MTGFLGQRIIVLPKDVISDIRNNPLIQTLYITDIGFFPRAEHHFRERKKGAKEYILIYCIEGYGMIEIYGQSLKISPNSFYIIPPDTSHKYYAIKKDPWSIYWIHFRGSHALHLYQKFCVKRIPVVKKAAYEEDRINLFKSLLDILEKGYSSDHLEYINICLWQLFSSFLYPEYIAVAGKTHKEGDLVGSAIGYMQNNIEKAISVGEIAEHFNYSSSHFFSLFKKKTGYSPIHYFNQLKIQKSCQYLSFSDISIKELSFKMGFDDPLYFSRVFKKIMGVPPLQYRKDYKP
jgi:AraC family transcriptional regulator, arabinose operon regulatory protein